MNLSYPQHIFKKIIELKKTPQNSLTQTEANEFASRPCFPLPQSFATILSTLSFSLMCIDAIPLNAIIAPIAILASFWINKLNLSKRSSISPLKMSKLYAYSIIKMM